MNHEEQKNFTRVRVGRRSRSLKRMQPADTIQDISGYDWFAAVIDNNRADLSERTARKAGLATFLPRENKRRWSNHVDRAKRVQSDKRVLKFPGLMFIGFPPLPDRLQSCVELHPWNLVDKIWFCRGVLGSGTKPVRIPLQARKTPEGEIREIGLMDVFEECRNGYNAAREQMKTGHEYNVGDEVSSATELFGGMKFKVLDIEGRYAKIAAPLLGGTRDIQVEVGSLVKA